ncbi:hypothetical protein Ae201684P_005990 [Aphanomyces euteiches]|nr:hypothetical protein Ae201684P_005990 [Aphanomyces euteiches]
MTLPAATGGRFALFEAIRSGKLAQVQAHITNQPESIRVPSITGAWPVQVAAECNRWDMVLAIVHADPAHVEAFHNIKSRCSNSLLQRLMVLLCQRFHHLQPQYSIHRLIKQGQGAAATALLKGAPHLVHSMDYEDGNTVAHVAAANSTLSNDLLELILPPLALLKNHDGQTPLHVAMEHGNLRALQVFIAALPATTAAELCMARDAFNSLPLHVALVEKHWHVILPLVTWHPPAAAQADRAGDMPIHLAASAEQWSIVSSLARLSPSSAAKPDRLGRSMLHVALRSGAWPAAKVLVGVVQCAISTDDVATIMEQTQWDLAAMLLYADGFQRDDGAMDTLVPLAARFGAPSHFLEAIHELTSRRIDSSDDKKQEPWAHALNLALKQHHWATAGWITTNFPACARQKNRLRLLPLQVAAADEAAPLWLLEQLAMAYPNVGRVVDRNGSPLLHVMCQRRQWKCVEAIVTTVPKTASLRDISTNLLPLEVAVASIAPASVIVALLEGDPFACKAASPGVWLFQDVWEKYAPSLSGSDVARIAAAVTKEFFKDADGNSALHIGVLTGDVRLCICLLRHATNIFATNAAGSSPYSLAMQSMDLRLKSLFEPLIGSSNVTKEWLETVDCDGKTPLVHAVEAELFPVAQRMLLHGADITKLKRSLAPTQRLLKNRYVVAMNSRNDDGSVWGLDLETARAVCVFGFASSETCRAHCSRLMRVQCRSRWICGVVEAFRDHATYYAVVETGLSRLKLPRGDIRGVDAMAVTETLCRALFDLHNVAKYVHHALTPESFVFHGDGVTKCKLSDWEHCFPRRTPWTQFQSPNSYISPRIASALVSFQDNEENKPSAVTIDGLDNIWSLGVMLFELWTAKQWMSLPFQVKSLASQAQDDVDERLSALPSAIQAFLRPLLAVDPSLRPCNMESVLSAPFFKKTVPPPLPPPPLPEISTKVDEESIRPPSLPPSPSSSLSWSLNDLVETPQGLPEQNQVCEKAAEDPEVDEVHARHDKEPEESETPLGYIGQTVRKRFEDNQIYRGVVKSMRMVDGKSWWTILYEDGDSEEVEDDELDSLLHVKIKGYAATSSPPLGQPVWLMYDKKLVAQGCVSAPPDSMLPPPSSSFVCLKVLKRFRGTPKEVMAQVQRHDKKPFVWWRVSQCFVPRS